VHFSAAGDTHAALDLADAHGAALFRSGRGRALVDLVKASSLAERAEHYPALYWAAVAASRMFDWDWAAAGFAEVRSTAGARGDAEMVGEALRSLAYMLNVWGRFAPAAAAARELIASIPDDQRAAKAAATLGHLVPGMTGTGQFTKAVELIRNELPKLASEPRADVDAETFARTVAAVTLGRDGDFAAAGAQLSLAGALTPGCSDDVVRTQVPWTRAMVGFLAGNPDAAEAAAREAEALALQVGDLQRILECRALQAMVHLLRGRATEAERGFSDVDELRAGITNFWVTILTLLSRPRRLLLSGDAVGALTAAESNHALANGVGEAWFVCFSRLEVIYLRILNGDVTSAVEMARAALAEARTLNADLLLYAAHLMLTSSSEEEREASLAEALRIADARDYRFVMPYAARLPQLDAALWRALGTPSAPRAAVLLFSTGPASARAFRTIFRDLAEEATLNAVPVLQGFGAEGRAALRELAACRIQRVADAAREAMVALDAANPHRLSGREREVLRLLTEGLRTKDIAERLVLTPATVSTHIQRIMAKTGTSSRAELLTLAARESVPDVK
jgi:DNA-binding CsgD family transcriptional regulator